MKLVLSLCILILGHSAFAGSSGGFDDVPAAKPAPKPAPAPSTNPSPTPAAPVKVTPSVKTNFPQCPNYTDNSAIAQKMFDEVLDFDRNFPIVLVENKPCTGYSCATVYLTKDKSTNVLAVQVVASITINSAAKVCRNGDKVQVTADDYGKVLIIEQENKHSVSVKVVGDPKNDNTYTVK